MTIYHCTDSEKTKNILQIIKKILENINRNDKNNYYNNTSIINKSNKLISLKIFCDKIENNGYKFKFKDIWKKLKSYF